MTQRCHRSVGDRKIILEDMLSIFSSKVTIYLNFSTTRSTFWNSSGKIVIAIPSALAVEILKSSEVELLLGNLRKSKSVRIAGIIINFGKSFIGNNFFRV